MYESFCLELEKIANPNILKYLDTYRPDAALSAIHKEFGLLYAYLKKEGLDPAVKSAIQNRIQDLYRTEYLVKAYKQSMKRHGRSRNPQQHLVTGFLEKLKDVTASEQSRLNETLMKGKISKQDAQIALKAKTREQVPQGLNKEYVENLRKHLGLSMDEKGLPKALINKVLSSSVRPDDIEASARVLRPFEKRAKQMLPVSGSAGRNKSGLATPKKEKSPASSVAPTMTRKLNKSLLTTSKKMPGNLINIGMSEPKTLGKIAQAKLPGMKLLSAESKRKVRKPRKEDLISKIPFSFKKSQLVDPPKTKLTKYLHSKGLK